MFHLDNIDWLEDTPDGKNTSHLLQLSVFQPRTQQKKPDYSKFIMDINKNKKSTLDGHSFNDPLKCNKPDKNQVTRINDNEPYDSDSIVKIENPTFSTWTTLKCMEVMLSSNHVDFMTEIGIEALMKIPPRNIQMQGVDSDTDTFNTSEQDLTLPSVLNIELDPTAEMKFHHSTTPQSLKIDDTADQVEEAILGTLKKSILNPIKLNIPTFAAVNSLVQDDINIGLTNVFKTLNTSVLKQRSAYSC